MIAFRGCTTLFLAPTALRQPPERPRKVCRSSIDYDTPSSCAFPILCSIRPLRSYLYHLSARSRGPNVHHPLSLSNLYNMADSSAQKTGPALSSPKLTKTTKGSSVPTPQ